MPSNRTRNSTSEPLNASSSEMNESICCFSPCLTWLFGGQNYESQPSPSSTQSRSPGHVEAGQYMYQAPTVSTFPAPRRYEDERGALLPKSAVSSAPVQGGDQERGVIMGAGGTASSASKSGQDVRDESSAAHSHAIQQQQQQQQQQQLQRKVRSKRDKNRDARQRDRNNASAVPELVPSAKQEGAAISIPQDEDDDFCPTCLEVYTVENPKIWTECRHHFHMPCIYEWMERSDTCPMCERKMVFPDQ